jgi:hypothetical protein
MASVCYPEITPELLRQLLDYDPETGVLTWKPRPKSLFASDGAYKRFHTLYEGKAAGSLWTSQSGGKYLQVRVLKTLLKAHRVAWAIHYGEWPSQCIDHIDGDGMNNRISNLRDVDHRTNLKNCKRWDNQNKTHAGVSQTNERTFVAYIGGKKYRKHLGSFRTYAEAVQARLSAEKELGYSSTHGKRS